jgi:hypothetical protein
LSTIDVDLTEPPGERDRLAKFPDRQLPIGRRLHRVHHAGLGPCWFHSSEEESTSGGRFDLSAPNGSSYWALQEAAAFLETVVRRPVVMIPLELLHRFHLTTVTLPSPLTAANSPVQKARGFGLTAEFHTTTDYPLTRRWARALHSAGHRALIAIPRHDVTARLRTVILFGRGGEHQPRGWARRLSTGPIPASLVDQMSAWGLRVVPIPFEVQTTDPDTIFPPE